MIHVHVGLHVALIVLSTALSAASTIPYIVATVRRTTRPRIVTWLTWSLLTAVAGAASASTHDWASACFSLIGTVVTAAVVVAGIRYGDRTFARLDAVCLVLVVAGVVAWQTLHVPGLAVVAACVIDFIGLVPTLVHSWRRPDEETALTYGLIAAGGLCAAAAAWGTWTVTALAYPLYVAVSMGVCWVVVLTRRAARARKATRAAAAAAAARARKAHRVKPTAVRPTASNPTGGRPSRQRNRRKRKRARRKRAR